MICIVISSSPRSRACGEKHVVTPRTKALTPGVLTIDAMCHHVKSPEDVTQEEPVAGATIHEDSDAEDQGEADPLAPIGHA